MTSHPGLYYKPHESYIAEINNGEVHSEILSLCMRVVLRLPMLMGSPPIIDAQRSPLPVSTRLMPRTHNPCASLRPTRGRMNYTFLKI